MIIFFTFVNVWKYNIICWITLCWCTKLPSKDNLSLLLFARKRDNRQSDGETIGKSAVRQDCLIATLLHMRHVSCTMHMPSTTYLCDYCVASGFDGYGHTKSDSETTEAMEVLMWALLCSVHAQRRCTTCSYSGRITFLLVSSCRNIFATSHIWES